MRRTRLAAWRTSPQQGGHIQLDAGLTISSLWGWCSAVGSWRFALAVRAERPHEWQVSGAPPSSDDAMGTHEPPGGLRCVLAAAGHD